MVEPGGVFNYLDSNGHSAVDHLQNLSERLDDPSLVDLMGTCHALRDGEFSRTAPTASEPTGRQVLRDAVDARRAIRVDELAQELDAGPEGLEGLLRSEAPIDCKRKNLKRRDVCLLAGLCVCDAAAVRATGIRLDGGFLPLQDVLGGAQSLDLRNTALGDLSILFLAKCLRFNTVLRSVNLAHNNIGVEGASKLAAVLKETKIEKLNLRDHDLNKDAVKALRDAAGSDIKIEF